MMENKMINRNNRKVIKNYIINFNLDFFGTCEAFQRVEIMVRLPFHIFVIKGKRIRYMYNLSNFLRKA